MDAGTNQISIFDLMPSQELTPSVKAVKSEETTKNDAKPAKAASGIRKLDEKVNKRLIRLVNRLVAGKAAKPAVLEKGVA